MIYEVLNNFVEFKRKSAYNTLERDDKLPLIGISNCQSPIDNVEIVAGAIEYVVY